MSISSSLSNALSGLNVTSLRAEVASNNIANALTEGYGRRELATASFTGGVKALGVTRIVSPGLIAERRIAEATLNADQRNAEVLGAVEQIIGAANDGDSIAARLSIFEAALISASGDPSSSQRLSQLNQTANGVVDKLKSSTTQLQKLRQEADLSIQNDVVALNRNLKMVEQLNADITRAKSLGQDPSSLFDARQQVVDEISAIVPLRELNRPEDQLGLMSNSGVMLIDGRASQFGFTNTPTITSDMTFQSGALSGITLDGVPLNGHIGVGKLSGGSLGAAFDARDVTLTKAQSGLDEFAFDLAMRFQNPTTDPTLISTGVLTDLGIGIDPANINGLAGRLRLNVTLDPESGGALSRWRDGVGATVVGPMGDSTQIERFRLAISSTGSSNTMSAAEKIAELSSSFSQARLSNEVKLSFSSARWDNLHNSELASGVDTDFELQNLLRVEQAYAANAKVIQTISAMMQRIMEI